jgi:hypothetical protein
MVNSKCQFTRSGTLDPAFHEERDCAKYQPDGKAVAYVRSNYCDLYHKDFLYMKEERDRKQQSKKGKGKTQIKGTGNEFSSSITFGVLYEGNTYELRAFRKDSIGISGLTSVNKQTITEIINNMLNYVNEVDPTLGVKIDGEPIITLCNAKYFIELPPFTSTISGPMFNLYRLNELIQNNYLDIEHWFGGRYLTMYDGSTAYFCARILFQGDIHLIKFYCNGKLNIYGGSQENTVGEIVKAFSTIVKNNYDYLVEHESIPTRKPIEIEYAQ